MSYTSLCVPPEIEKQIGRMEVLPFPLIPDRVYQSILDIDPLALAGRGISLLLADLDNTLARYGQRTPDGALIAWKDALAAEGVALYLLSNSRKPGRAAQFAQVLGIPFQGRAGKPSPKGFQTAMERMGRTPAQTAMVGDQIFTDILGARRAGVLALMVEPIELAGNPGRYLRYGVETPFRALGKRKNRSRV